VQTAGAEQGSRGIEREQAHRDDALPESAILPRMLHAQATGFLEFVMNGSLR
jgi:hypothetical protein